MCKIKTTETSGTITVSIKVKALSRREPLIGRVPFEIPENIETAKALIECIVRLNACEYNSKSKGEQILPYLTNESIEDGTVIGKVGFGDRKNENFQDADKAVSNALTCFEDGIFRLFINDEEAGVDDAITIKDGDEVAFIRLTMLAGRRW